MELTGRTAIVTGASRGIGRAVALGLAARGAAVAVGCRTRTKQACEVAERIELTGGRAFARAGDLAVESEVLGLFDETVARFGGVDIVVANAASLSVGPFAEITEAEFDAGVAANLKSTFLTLREAARRVGDNGRVIAVSTGATRLHVPQMGLYLGAKGAVEQFVRVLARELGGRGITVNAVSPGATDTDQLLDSFRDAGAGMSALGRLGQPEDIADVITFLAGPGGRWITGQNIGATGGVA